jgi:hypothetical protein
MKRVFVSYSRNNLDVVTQLVNDVQAVGIDTWHDQTLTGGRRWWDAILSNIREADIFICALAPQYWESEACKCELAYAVQLGKAILPVLVADGINLNLLPAPLNEIQVTDYRGRDKNAAFALIRCIHTAPDNPPMPDPLPAPPATPVSYLSSLTERIDSREPLSSQDQITLLFELEAGLREGRSRTEIRDLLLRLKRRDELLAKVAVNVDAALKSIEEEAPAQPVGNTAFRATASARPVSSRQNEAIDSNARSGAPRYCPKCKTQAVEGAKFCKVCGSALAEVARSTSRRYVCGPGDSERVIDEVKSWLNFQGFDSQRAPTETGGILLQIKKRGGWRDLVGMATAVNIVFHPTGDTLTVEIGAGKWMDKAVVGSVSMVILWPLALTAGIGAWDQWKMPEKIFQYIGTRLAYK